MICVAKPLAEGVELRLQRFCPLGIGCGALGFRDGRGSGVLPFGDGLRRVLVMLLPGFDVGA